MPASGSSIRRASRAVASPSGTFTKKIQCQSIACVITPPASSPTEPPAEATNAYTPIARACSLRLGEHRHDHAEDHRRGHRAADPLHEARGDQQRLAVGEPAQQRGEREDGDPGEEHAAPSDQIAEPPRQQQEPAEGDQIAVHHPCERRARETQLVLDRGQRDVHDRHVQDDHHHPGAEHVQRRPAAIARLAAHAASASVIRSSATRVPCSRGPGPS